MGARDLGGRGEHAHRDGKIEAGTLLPGAGGRQVDDDAAKGPRESGALYGRAHALARVLDAGSRQPGHRERREAPPHVCLDPDQVPLDADHRHPEDPAVHGTSERFLEELDGGTAGGIHPNARHVEADGIVLEGDTREERLREQPKLPLLAGAHGLERSPEVEAPPRLHLADDDQPVPAKDEVDLPQRAPPVLRDQLEAARAIGRERRLLTGAAELQMPGPRHARGV